MFRITDGRIHTGYMKSDTPFCPKCDGFYLWIGSYEFEIISLRLRGRNHRHRNGVCDDQRLEQDLKGDSKED